MYKDAVLPHDLIKLIFSFCDEQTLLQAHRVSEGLFIDAQYVLNQRLKQELMLFGIKPEEFCLEKLSFKQIYQLRSCLWAMAHHDTFAAQALISITKNIKTALTAIINEEAHKPIINYLYNIFSALARGRVPIIEQLPFLATLETIRTPIQQRLTAIYYYSKNDAACLPLFKQLAQSKNDPVANWYLFQIYRLGLCHQALNITLAKEYLDQASTQCVKSPEFVYAYRETLKKKVQRSLCPSPFPSLIDSTILDLAKQLNPKEKDTLIQNLTHQQKNSKSLKKKI